MNRKNYEFASCNFCNSKDYEIIYKDLTYWEYPGSFTLVKCGSCKLIYINPRPKLSEMEKYYETEMYFGRDVIKNDEINDSNNREIAYGPIYQLILSKKKKGSVFDIGAGTGMLLSKFKDLKWDVDGIELTGSAVRYAKRKYKINLRQGDILNKKISKKYDFVVLNGALEHLHQPLQTLIKANKILNTKGAIVISVPNNDSIGRLIFGRNWFPWQPPRHLYHFTPKTINKMLLKAGFKKIKIHFNYDVQNYYIIFQSARYLLSPKFKKMKSGGLKNPKKAFKSSPSVKKQIGKILFSIIACVISKVEPFARKGEVMIVYAEK